MPATGKGKTVAGVDGCPFGWIAAIYCPASGETRVAIADSFKALLDGPLALTALVVVDMPVGLADTASRQCEIEARRAIGARHSSVFPSPLRGMLAFEAWNDANAFGKMSPRSKGLPKQTWAITPKIRELDELMTPTLQARILEGHPELAFTRLGDTPCAHNKRTTAGQLERQRLLSRSGIDAATLLRSARVDHPLKKHFADDDLIDACAMALTAEAIKTKKAWRLGDGARDARGLLMEICG